MQKSNKYRALIGLVLVLVFISIVDASVEVVYVDIVNTRNLTITFVPLDDPNNLGSFVEDSVDFLEKTYPIADRGFLVRVENPIDSNIEGLFKTQQVLKKVYKSSLISGQFSDVAVGVVRTGWFEDVLSNSNAIGVHGEFYPSMVVEETYGDTVAHELGHEYGLCDEYNSFTWSIQNIIRGCPNGDKNINGFLDEECKPNGCSTASLEPLSGFADEEVLYNFMGSPTNRPWIDRYSFNHLLGEFTYSTPENADKRIMLSGNYNNETNSFYFDNFYVLGSGYTNNKSDFTNGDFSIELRDESGNSITNISFNLSFYLFYRGGNVTPVSEAPFTFIVPFAEDLSSIVFKENNTVKNFLNRTANTPSVNITSDLSGKSFSNEIINISWSASDLDGDGLNYAVLLLGNENNITLTFDYANNSFEINSSELSECLSCRIKVLVTDGINTNYSISDSFSIENIPQNKFFIKNSTNGSVSWFGDSGNLVLKGKCFAQSSCVTNDGNSFIIANSTDSTVAFINSTGDLCVERGDCSAFSAKCNPTRDAFIIQNSTRNNMSYIDFNGDLCLTGGLYQNFNL